MNVSEIAASWQGPDRTLRQRCECGHNLAQHSYSRGPCNYGDFRDGCGCSRFTRNVGESR